MILTPRALRVAIIVAGLALGSLLSACAAPTHDAGERCLFSDECARGLLCVGGFCRVECRTDRDCTNDWRCLGSGVAGKLVCLESGPAYCLYTSECAANELCTRDGRCRAQCQTQADCAAIDARLACQSGSCRWPNE